MTQVSAENKIIAKKIVAADHDSALIKMILKLQNIYQISGSGTRLLKKS